MNVTVEVKGPQGPDIPGTIDRLTTLLQPTGPDLLAAAKFARTWVLDLTASGKDYLGRTFKKYSPRRAYLKLNSPGGASRKVGKPTPAGAKQFRKITGRNAKQHQGYQNRLSGSPRNYGGDTWISRTGRSMGFSNRHALKNWLGRPRDVVDLQSAGGPHMLNEVLVRSDPAATPRTFAVYIDNPEKAELGRIHNEGSGNMPKRRWLDASAQLVEKLHTLLAGFISNRVRIFLKVNA